jgi:hypothetical protein
VAEVKSFAAQQAIPLFHFEGKESKDLRAQQMRRERPVQPVRLVPKSNQNLPKNLCLWGSNRRPCVQSMRVARALEIGEIADGGMPPTDETMH